MVGGAANPSPLGQVAAGSGAAGPAARFGFGGGVGATATPSTSMGFGGNPTGNGFGQVSAQLSGVT